MATVRGSVKFFSSKRGYGFIIPDDPEEDGQEYFVHHSVIAGDGFRSLADGEEVEFEVKKDPATQKLCAINVRGPDGSEVQGASKFKGAKGGKGKSEGGKALAVKGKGSKGKSFEYDSYKGGKYGGFRDDGYKGGKGYKGKPDYGGYKGYDTYGSYGGFKGKMGYKGYDDYKGGKYGGKPKGYSKGRYDYLDDYDDYDYGYGKGKYKGGKDFYKGGKKGKDSFKGYGKGKGTFKGGKKGGYDYY
mmetsp:Transcript_96705/g.152408  ORF Transcript_96705/g.152408 Transcript_96705/m.152408 type:complete len:244 (-) Transcript_96705:109-840(-)|eukprot:CAMPEP_0169108226 /NCGR_PEP_ID=MMETSP1015-20121227/25312_1 /TAXON_ID=342587 /ORGANISM="Karlodinium micrum, Strain CCMP2283" /LENGTH=243 /DNA_ID=CAMNT_0009169829 /DNA_START=10 /DNA_END=741 /DNA_ORIENTATION=+